MTRLKQHGVLIAIGLWAVWVIATWWFEGRIETFARPSAVVDRLVYTGLANIAIGILGSTLVLGVLLRGGLVSKPLTGFASPLRTAIWVPVGLILGLSLYFGQGAPSANTTVILNAFAQVFVVSAAEVLVCWSVVASTIASGAARSRRVSIVAAAAVASLLFGLYHFAHSAPFNTFAMVGFLSLVGFGTSLFFFVSGDVYATIVFHNFLGVYGVVEALVVQDNVTAFESLQIPLISTAAVALVILIAVDVLIVRKAVGDDW